MGRLWENMGQFMRTGAVNPEVSPLEREIPRIKWLEFIFDGYEASTTKNF
jgi:hypothetical protein